MGVYLATDQPQPLVEWREEEPSFNVTDLSEDEAPVRGRFSKPHVYYLGAYTGCSCGFTPDEDGEEADAERSLSDLVSYVQRAAAGGTVELFACWDGDYLEPAARRVELTAEDLADPELWFDELVFATVHASKPAFGPASARARTAGENGTAG
jgi:hypothetical protein